MKDWDGFEWLTFFVGFGFAVAIIVQAINGNL